MAASISFRFPMDLVWLLLEAGVALALLLWIVWWTWPRAKKNDAGSDGERRDRPP